MDECAEDFPGPELLLAVEAYFAQERSWHRLLRGTRLVTNGEAAQGLEGRTATDPAE
ncbi:MULTISPECIES: hypothetical protein [Mycolicibacterium]|uniref:Uncharacterized protein n=1 Tax=Mycolicibacterium senegalense TaxID=1796 RepID=A0A378T263_9MYCO|nr:MULTISPECIES: hypothetical protein [Mycolicibacterium]MCV7335362.1 hypothetical protein [Mycolicibacterium senegalense]MDR7290684.1 hypothetical protein [Mycolicibacterium senegalense]QZA22254.1 hypothetical protein K3U95_15890 [Mycolicibacterium senegalense]CDP89241.1 hypothetical protein BN975_05092 [Mycolicibacterium farcinogenes]STZ53963.1 Uncharacterised protein [Mycolicibacterium senegalense]